MKLIPIGGIRGKGKFLKVDDEDFPLLSRYKWHAGTHGEAFCHIAGRRDKYPIHRLIINPRRDQEVDHKNGDKLDNQKANLRACSRSQNGRNSKLSKNSTSGYKGVSWAKHRSKWEAYIKVNYIRKHLGLYKEKEDAARAYNKAAKKYFGEYARLNEICGKEKGRVRRVNT